jgi:hypothetical protein
MSRAPDLEAEMGEDAPKSAFELAMERLRRKDEEEGREPQTLSDEQRERIAEIRRLYEARLAEREILHRSERSRARDPEALERLEDEYRRDREHLVAEREQKLTEARQG